MAIWAIVFLVLTFPFCIYATWSDLKFLKIPNIVPLGLLVTFVISGVFVLPFPEYWLSLLYGFIALLISLVIFAARLVPGGDLKYIASIIPFINTQQLVDFTVYVALATIMAVFTHFLFGRLGFAPDNWASWNSGSGRKRRFPVGFAITGGLIIYFVVQII